jgi:hypothetical protein
MVLSKEYLKRCTKEQLEVFKCPVCGKYPNPYKDSSTGQHYCLEHYFAPFINKINDEHVE